MENYENVENNEVVNPVVEDNINTEEVKPEKKKDDFFAKVKEKFDDFLRKAMIFCIGVLVGIVLILGASLMGVKNPFAANPKKNITVETIGAKIEDVAELVTIKYRYTQVGKIESNKVLGDTSLVIPLSKSLIIIKIPGIINVGFDFNKVKVLEVNHNEKVVKISMPEPKILSNEILNKEVEILTEQNEIFNQKNISDYNELLATQKELAAEEAVTNGVFDMAKSNAELIITKFILEIVNDNSYTVEFKY